MNEEDYRQKPCRERVVDRLRGRIEDLKVLWKAYCNGDEEVEDLGNIYEYGLSFDYVPVGTFNDQEEGYFRYQLSWGGPSDEFRYFVDYDGEIYRIEYWFLDWFDGAKKVLNGENYSLLNEIFDWFKECGTVDHVYKEAIE